MAKRRYRPVAESYITEWLGITYPPGTWRTNVAFGEAVVPEEMKITPSEQKFISKPLRPIADAVVFLENEVHIIEAKVRDERGKIEQLLIYRWLFPKTPEFKQHWHKKIRTILLTPKDQGNFINFLKLYNIEVVYYRPRWIIEYLNSLERRYRRGTYYSLKI